MQRSPLVAVVGFGLLLVSCTGNRREPFTPTERATGLSRTRQVQAEYEVLANGHVAGEAKVWSKGAFREKQPNDREGTLLHVAFTLESTEEAPLVLEVDNVELETVETNDRVIKVADPSYVQGSAVSRGGDEAEVHLYFRMPADLKPQELDAFRVRWSVVSEGERYEQQTPFLEYETSSYAYYPYYSYPFCDHYFCGPWPGGYWSY